MRVANVHDFFRSTGFYKFLYHFAAVMFGVFDLTVKLAVRERPCAAFAKLHIGFWIECVLTP
jgi:hypothetical protein